MHTVNENAQRSSQFEQAEEDNKCLLEMDKYDVVVEYNSNQKNTPCITHL